MAGRDNAIRTYEWKVMYVDSLSEKFKCTIGGQKLLEFLVRRTGIRCFYFNISDFSEILRLRVEIFLYKCIVPQRLENAFKIW